MNNGRVEFSQLCTGSVRGYSFNLVDVGIGTPISSMEQTLIAQVKRTVRELERCSGRRIAKIYIGKTYIPRRRTPRGGFVPFSCMNPNTWRMAGISSRWHSHHGQDYGRDGLVVLCAVTRDNVPEGSTMSQEQLALAMEQKLLHHYRLAHPDPRFVNETFTTGHLAQYNYHAYAVYMAFRYEEASGDSPQLSTTPPRAARAVRIQQQEADQTTHPSSLPTMSQPAPSYTSVLPSCRPLVMSVNRSPNSRMMSNNQPRTKTNSQQSATIVNKSLLVQRPSHTSHYPTSPQAARANPKLSAIPKTVPGPSHTSSGPEQSQKRSTKRKHSTSSTSVSLSQPPNIPPLSVRSSTSSPSVSLSIPCPSSSPAKGAKRSHKQTGRTNSQPLNTVPAQNAHQSKRLLQDPKDKMSRKRSQTSSSQTPPKRPKLASNATSNAPGPSNASLSRDTLPRTDSPPDDSLLDSPPVSQSTREDSGPSYVNSDSTGSASSPIVILDDKSEPSQLLSSDSDSDTDN